MPLSSVVKWLAKERQTDIFLHYVPSICFLERGAMERQTDDDVVGSLYTLCWEQSCMYYCVWCRDAVSTCKVVAGMISDSWL